MITNLKKIVSPVGQLFQVKKKNLSLTITYYLEDISYEIIKISKNFNLLNTK